MSNHLIIDAEGGCEVKNRHVHPCLSFPPPSHISKRGGGARVVNQIVFRHAPFAANSVIRSSEEFQGRLPKIATLQLMDVKLVELAGNANLGVCSCRELLLLPVQIFLGHRF
ncbi:hypothetical protein NPIL_459151 [Nephila pilipes]|uniref:Uncharacterized protein n=1 Tax=Nephila pilipes TaxID=299642 RepID=A0A8X6PVI1_NEPPI|nr:hypothetical protein NPIL_459151 [Nephila pilipes]